jgi:pilus assembly protein FimV
LRSILLFPKDIFANVAFRGALMVAKRSSRAVVLLLALPSAAFALGLGDIRLNSPLNAPLNADIELIDIAPDEANTVQAQLASRDTFASYGLDWAGYLSGVTVKTERASDGRQVIHVRSNDPISDPFVTLLIEVNWSHGHLVREYTMLLDPPVYTPGQSSVASAPVTAPSTGAAARAGTIERAPETAAAPPPAPAPAATAAAAPAEAATAAAVTAAAAAVAGETASGSTSANETASNAMPTGATPATAPPATATASAAGPAESAAPVEAPAPTEALPRPSRSAPAPSAAASEEGTHVVTRGETLSGIASGVAGAGTASARTRSYMLAIYQANPRAFDQNMNLLRAGAVLRIPDAAAAANVSPGEASAEIRRQYAAWRGATGTAPAGGSEQPGRLRLVTPSQGAAAGTSPGSQNAEVSELQGRVHELQAQLEEQKRLVEMKNADLARLQAQLAAKASAPAAPPAAVAPPAVAKPPAASPPVVQAPPPAAEQKPPVEAAPSEQAPPPPAPPPVTAPVTKPLAKVTATPPPAPSGGSFLETLMGLWWLLALLGVAALGFFGLRFVRSRRSAEFNDSLGRLAVAGAAAAAGDHLGDFGSDIPRARGASPSISEESFVVEETGSHERPRIAPTPVAAPAAPAPAAAARSADDTISSETAINLDQGDPLAEADFHMAYGLYDQAADLIRIAIQREPERRDLKLKLLEVFFVWGNKEQFLQTARELAGNRAEAAPGEWEKILIMGKQLAPEDQMFSGAGAGAVSGAAAGGVDLDLEGGQSRVDFDLLGGEPGAGEAGQAVDLDIGAAVGENTGESSISATDRNQALEGTLSGVTGNTRQMTARMRQSGGGDGDAPTVEQPQLRAAEATVRQKLETALKQGGSEQTQELAIDDLGLDLGHADTIDQPGLAASAPEGPTLVAGLDEETRRLLEDTAQNAVAKERVEKLQSTGAWQFDPKELDSAATQAGPTRDIASTSRLAALRAGGVGGVDVDVGDATGTHPTAGTLDLDVGSASGMHPGSNGAGLDLDVGTATVPDAAFAATQRLASEDLALPDLEPVTMSEVGTKLDLARAYMDMGDPDGARNILEEVLNEGSAAQKQEAQRLMESLPG